MSKHQLTYLDLHPEPVDTREPSTLTIWAGAAFALGAVYLLTVIVFSF